MSENAEKRPPQFLRFWHDVFKRLNVLSESKDIQRTMMIKQRIWTCMINELSKYMLFIDKWIKRLFQLSINYLRPVGW